MSTDVLALIRRISIYLKKANLTLFMLILGHIEKKPCWIHFISTQYLNWFELTMRGSTFNVIATYRPPSAPFSDFNDSYFELLDLVNLRENVVIFSRVLMSICCMSHHLMLN